MEVVDRALALTSRSIQSAGLVLLTSLLSCLVGVFPKLDKGPFEKMITQNGVLQWTSKYQENFEAPMYDLGWRRILIASHLKNCSGDIS